MPKSKKNSLKNMDVDPEKSFWLCDGRILKNLKELGEALEKMDEAIWKYHVTSEKNDFANWAGDVFEDAKLASEIKKSRNAKSAAKKINAKIGGSKLWTFF